MTIYVIDSSALVKRYVGEIGSNWVRGIFEPTLNNEVFIAAITAVEIIAAITRRSLGGSLSTTEAIAIRQQFKNDCDKQYQIVEIGEDIINSGMALAEIYGLRAYDAIQLAVGCAVNSFAIANGLHPIIFVSADNELNAAVVKEGLIMENPNMSP
ncbi:MAG: hypothetical protein Fur0025_21530 [Oscillatoriaceae cyanobacterium]